MSAVKRTSRESYLALCNNRIPQVNGVLPNIYERILIRNRRVEEGQLSEGFLHEVDQWPRFSGDCT